ncbi:ABC transporter permease [Ahrensia sp. R2A130]|uniref:ABC transporter permease n=1 Tax=Ahrensia sp. R2A130 TaxID=744979 RepID=UPI0001E083A4|nr:ABC transporter permease [Ahrensia sp. R2A130]EFL90504.1 ABC transporter inner membrane protein [Ahrensia sp. R2A130]
MRGFQSALSALLSHWRRRPGQFVTLVLGLSLATALWTAVQAINSEARSSYDRAANQVAGADRATLEKADGGAISMGDFVRLRRAGWLVTTVLEGRLQRGRVIIRIVGIDPLTSSAGPLNFEGGSAETPYEIQDFIGQNGLALAAPETIAELDGVPNLPRLIPQEGLPPRTLTVDIAAAQALLQRPDAVSRLVLLDPQPVGAAPLGDIAPDLTRVEPQTGQDLARLTDSFHLNLTAFGLLTFAVGLFIVHGTIGLAFEQRRVMFRTLRVLGVSLKQLVVALVVELAALAVLAGTVGVLLGSVLATLLLPNVADTLRDLYGAQVSGSLGWRADWWASGIAIALLGTAIAAAGSLWRIRSMPILASAQPRAWAMVSSKTLVMQAVSGFVFLGLAAVLLGLASGIVAAFIIIALVLVGSALLLPPLANRLLDFGQSLARRAGAGATAQWFWADTRQQIPGLSLALMALLLALAANIGVGTMVGSFRTTFVGWLDQRLAAEFYVNARDGQQGEKLKIWLQTRTDAVLPIVETEATLDGRKGAIFGVANHATYRDNWPLLERTPQVWDEVARGEGLLVNEQFARRSGLSLGDEISAAGLPPTPIAGVYSDYGNPAPQVMVGLSKFSALFPNIPQQRFGVRVPPERVEALKNEISAEFGIEERSMIDQSAIKDLSLSVFERTFRVTDALNVLTLAVAGFAIFTSLLTLATMRVPQLAPVWALGLTQRRLAALELARTAILALVTVVLAVPVGLALAWLLLAVLNVEAFGWRIPMQVFVGDWLRLGLLALLAALLAAAIPARRMAAMAPADLVKVFSHER